MLLCYCATVLLCYCATVLLLLRRRRRLLLLLAPRLGDKQPPRRRLPPPSRRHTATTSSKNKPLSIRVCKLLRETAVTTVMLMASGYGGRLRLLCGGWRWWWWWWWCAIVVITCHRFQPVLKRSPGAVRAKKRIPVLHSLNIQHLGPLYTPVQRPAIEPRTKAALILRAFAWPGWHVSRSSWRMPLLQARTVLA